VKLLFLPSLVVIAINIGIFFLIYRQQLKGRFDSQRLPSPQQTIRHEHYFRYSCFVLACTAAAYVVASALQFHLSLVSIAGAIALLFGAIYWRRTTYLETAKRISWSIFGFIAGMIIVVKAVEDTGITTKFGRWLLQLSANTGFGAAIVGTLGSAIGTNLINNVPMAVLMTSAMRPLQQAPVAVRHGFVAGTIFGCALGPNLTIIGSLATVLWLLILRRRGVDVSGLDYFKVGVVVTPIMLVAGALTIWLLL
jgi:arsenical pump membrane protein